MDQQEDDDDNGKPRQQCYSDAAVGHIHDSIAHEPESNGLQAANYYASPKRMVSRFHCGSLPCWFHYLYHTFDGHAAFVGHFPTDIAPDINHLRSHMDRREAINMLTDHDDIKGREAKEAREASVFAAKISSVCTAIGALSIPYHGRLKGIDHSLPDSAWSTLDTIAAGMRNCTEAQAILKRAGFKLSDDPRLQMAVAMLKNRAESLSAESDGFPAITTFFGVWLAGVAAMAKIVMPSLSPATIAWGGTMIALVMGVYFLSERLASRRKVAMLKELAVHIELFAKSMKPPVELDPPFRLQPTDRKRSNA